MPLCPLAFPVYLRRSLMLFASLFTALFTICVVGHPVVALWPLPRALRATDSLLKLSTEFEIHIQFKAPPSDLRAAITRTKSRLFSDKLQRLVLGRGSTDGDYLRDAHALVSLELFLNPGCPARSIADETNQPIEAKSESYSLFVPADNSSAIINANSTLGLFRGLTTFEQLWYDYQGTKYTLQGGMKIDDEPAFVCTGTCTMSPHVLTSRSLIVGSPSIHLVTCTFNVQWIARYLHPSGIYFQLPRLRHLTYAGCYVLGQGMHMMVTPP